MTSAQVSVSVAGGGAVPRHVAIIMDGNGRWAKRRHLPRVAGHRAGAEAVRRTIRAAAEMGIAALTLYAFSSENWRRPAAEVSDLMGLLQHYLRAELEELAGNGIRLVLIGDYRSFDPDLVAMLDGAVERTRGNRRMTLAVALNYGAQDELVRAARAIAADAAAGRVDPDQVTAAQIEARLDTATLPPLDLLIRTSGEKRLSNFLLWQAAYAELAFVDTLWPDFDGDALAAACVDFAGRERRYGGLAWWALAVAAAFLMLAEWGGLARASPGRLRVSLLLFAVPAIALLPPMLGATRDAVAVLAGAAIVVALALSSMRLGLGLAYAGLPVAGLLYLRGAPHGFALTLWTLAIVWATDIGAYFAGRAIGGPKLAPRVSPNKTWAGLGGGVAAALAAGAAVAWGGGLAQTFLWLGAPLAVLAQAGDLFESALKRRAGVKDSGRLLPGHGGALDRLDGLAPVATLVAALLAGGVL